MRDDMEPMTELAEQATSLHEMYLALVAAGFRPDQALYLTAQVITANIPNDMGESQ